MCSKHLGADFVYAWPTAQIAVMGAEGAVNIVYGREIKAAADPQGVRSERIDQYNEEFLNPHLAAKAGYVDEVIAPEQTRRMVFNALKLLSTKKTTEKIAKRHGNIPL